jgi:hypothetical protein
MAVELGKTVEEVMQMSTVELAGWVKYFEFVAEENKARNNN